jgi:hypothetical protein
MAPRPLLRCASQVLDRGAQAVARGAARCLSQVLGRGAKAVAHGAARCALQVLCRGAKAAARGAAALPQPDKDLTSRRCPFGEFESLAVDSRRR